MSDNNLSNTNRMETYQLKNNQGDELVICNYGARMAQWHTTVNGESRNIILGFDNINDYLNDGAFLGAIVGPFANRVGGAKFTVNGTQHSLSANEGVNQLHGGPQAFGQQFWQCKNKTPNSVTLVCDLEDGFNGYPGPIHSEITYELTENSECIISGKLTSEQLTAIGPTSHPYFNLAGMENDSQSHQLQINAANYTVKDDAGIPTGEIKSVNNTALDFRENRTLSLAIGQDDIDDNFVIDNHGYVSHQENTCNKQAVLTSPDESLALHVSANLPGLQIYTARYLEAPFTPFQGICLEPQFFPDSPNKPDFPFEFTGPNNPLDVKIVYALVK